MYKVETGKAKANFSAIKKRAQTQDVAITSHGKVEAYLVSPERYNKYLAVAETAPDAITRLENEWTRRIEEMQTPEKLKLLAQIKHTPLEVILREGALAEPAQPAERTPTRRSRRRAASR